MPATAVDQGEQRGARTAFFGAVLGALIGGVGTFGGAYLNEANERDRALYERREAVYVEFVDEAEEYRTALLELRFAVEARNQEQYAERRDLLFRAASELYSSYSKVRLTLPDTKLAGDMMRTLFNTNEPPNVNDVDLDRLAETIDSEEYTNALKAFIDGGRKDLGNE